jgi:hypothetical protein
MTGGRRLVAEERFEGVDLFLQGDDVESKLFYFLDDGFLGRDEGDALVAYLCVRRQTWEVFMLADEGF